jgi:mRNA interferase RelE/StbE
VPYTPVAVRNFHNVKKKLPPTLREEIDQQVDLICEDPSIGEQKTGDLRDVLVHKFSMAGQLYLLAYWADEEAMQITLLAIGGHQNFYRDLKKYLKS